MSVTKLSISLSDKNHSWAEQVVLEEGFATLSAYISELIRRDYHARQRRQARLSQHKAPHPDGKAPSPRPS
jgi:Arc/MetJ-type ribon-helix-helix transcriptional regulator